MTIGTTLPLLHGVARIVACARCVEGYICLSQTGRRVGDLDGCFLGAYPDPTRDVPLEALGSLGYESTAHNLATDLQATCKLSENSVSQKIDSTFWIWNVIP